MHFNSLLGSALLAVPTFVLGDIITDTSKVPRTKFGKVPYGVNIKSCTVPGKVALTFDDGPYIYTTQVLDTLKKYSAKATFFVVALNGGKAQIDLPGSGYPAIIQRAYQEGHQIASHSWSHQDFSALNHQQRLDQILKNEVALTHILGFFPTYLRPPYVSCNADCLKDITDLGYHSSFYDLDTNDWKGDYAAAKNVFSSSLRAGKPASSSFVVLAHDIHEKTATELLPYMLDEIKKSGYTTATLGECLGDPPENWYRDPLTGGPESVAKNNQLPNTSSPDLPARLQGNATNTTATPVPGIGSFSARSSGTPVASTNKTNGVSSSLSNALISMPMVITMLVGLVACCVAI